MDAAIGQAYKARAVGEVPVGAVLVDESGEMLASAFNQCIRLSDATAHAEILAIRAAADRLQNYRLLNATLYVTIEPCIMCMGAVIHARLKCVVFGTRDPRWGAAGSLYDFSADRRLNHSPKIVSGVRENECRELIVDFFTARREKQTP
ncbi:MAG: tRNA adenosine(34) deaminase TadA [Desulfobacterales bacterium]|nr:tRNA adenosine(34) deaminase TadA [Desulfobacterales bacterium]MBS3754735.1 tRNA adenosine(34) deaminase TadA [Desulfobacterales bacterium]